MFGARSKKQDTQIPAPLIGGESDTIIGESIKKTSAISLFVSDLQKAKSSYEVVFEIAVVLEDDLSAFLQFDNMITNLLDVRQAHTLFDPGIVADRNVSVQRVGRRCGCRLLGP